MDHDDKALHETLDLLSQVVASVSDRLDRQSETLDRLEATQAAASPDRVAGATAPAVREALGPQLLKIVSVLEERAAARRSCASASAPWIARKPAKGAGALTLRPWCSAFL